MSRSPSLGLLLLLGALTVPATACRATMPPLPGNPVPNELKAAFQEGLFALPERPRGLGVSSVQSRWRVPVILVSYSDQALTYGAAAFDSALFDSTGATPTGSVHDYYRWVSGDRLNVTGEVVATAQLANNKVYYGNNSWGLSRTATPHNVAGLAKDALMAVASQVNWSDYDLDGDGYVDMLWVVHAGIGGETSPDRYDNDVWSITSQFSGSWYMSSAFQTPDLVPGSSDRYVRVDRFTVLPELSAFHEGNLSEIGVYCHEFGHALGLPDLYDVADGGKTDIGPGCWSLMGSGGWGGNGYSPEYPTHLGAWPSLYLGWAQALTPTEDTPVTLAPIQDGQQVLELSFQGEGQPEHFLVEARTREGFDRKLPTDGLIVSHVNEDVIYGALASNRVNSGTTPGLVVLEGDGAHDLTTGQNRGDSGDPFPGASGRTLLFDDTPAPNTLTFYGNPTGVGLFDIAPVSGGWSFLAQVRAVGWQPAVDVTAGTYAPVESQTPASTAVLTADGSACAVASESRDGHLQIVLRTRTNGVWDSGIVVTQSSGDAYEPTLARLGTNDLALAWSDTRGGAARIYYRARVGGVWTEETLLDATAGEHRSPSVRADDAGGVHVAWVFVGQDAPQIRYMRFPYLSAYGQPFVLSGTAEYPSKPVVAVLPNRGAIVAWVDNAAWPSVVRFARCASDSVPSTALRLTPQSGNPQTWASTLVDTAGDLHTVWIENVSGQGEIHYQHRGAGRTFVQEDTLLETSDGTINRIRLARDDGGGLHIIFERTVDGVSQVGYRRWRPLAGWDAFSTEVSTDATESAFQPSVLPLSTGNVIVIYRALVGSTPRAMERIRLTDQPAIVAVPETPVSAPAPARALLLPNPVRAGHAVEILWSASPAGGSGAVDVFDLAGRHVATTTLVAQGSVLRSRLGGELTRQWHAGVFFVRRRGDTAPAQRLVVLR